MEPQAARALSADEVDAMNGRTQALVLTLTSLIASLPQLCAAEAAVRLLIAQAEERQNDGVNQTSAAWARSRDAIVDGYVELLSVRSKVA